MARVSLNGHSYSLLINMDWGKYSIAPVMLYCPQFKTSNNNNKNNQQQNKRRKITPYSLTPSLHFGRLIFFLAPFAQITPTYCVQFPLFKKNVDKKEWVQQRFKALREKSMRRLRWPPSHSMENISGGNQQHPSATWEITKRTEQEGWMTNVWETVVIHWNTNTSDENGE